MVRAWATAALVLSPLVTGNALREDHDALVDMYNSMGGAKWPAGFRWNVADKSTACNWANVTCDETGRVTKIWLDNLDHVEGTIPDSIVDMDKLTHLRLKNNPGLSGTIPQHIGRMTGLSSLVIGRDKVSGTIPESMYDCWQLEQIYFKQNSMSGTLSESLGDLKKLRKMDLRESNFEGTLPKSISKLHELETLILEDNGFRGFLPELPPSVKTCHLSDMTFDTPYESRVSTPLKRGFGGSNTQFACPLPNYVPEACKKSLYCTTEPKQAEAMKDCAILADMYRAMGGPKWKIIGSQFGLNPDERWTNVNWDIKDNPYGCCDWIGVKCDRHNRVKRLWLQNVQQMTGTLPPEIVGLDMLDTLRLKSSPISGTLPADIGLLSKLEDLELGRDQLSGTIPFSLYGIESLKQLYFKQSFVSGTISEAIGNLRKLEELDIRESKFEGTLPAAISSLSKLETFNVEDNAWRGFLPSLPATIKDCAITDITFDDEYESRVATPRGKDWHKRGENAEFNCPLPANPPEDCKKTMYCKTDAFPGPEWPKTYAAPAPPADTSAGFNEGLVIGVVIMVAVMAVLALVLYSMRKQVVRLVVTEAKPIAREMQTSSSSNGPKV